ncbi:MAG: hypothetical protein DIJKHBIC_00888 [Thermoanaerobaculia bacterium]|nr:hypothetical protein [Thermoanaerobaculia bacterium]
MDFLSRLHSLLGRAPDPLSGLDPAEFSVLPALVNAHDHLTLNALPRPEGLPLFSNASQWFDALTPYRESPHVREVQRIPERVRAWHGGIKNLLSGVTRVVHHDPWRRVFSHRHFPVTVLHDYDWCHSLELAGRYGPALPERGSERPWFIHLAEGVDKAAAVELDTLRAEGGLDRWTVLVHGTGLTAEQAEDAVKAGASLVWCPASNRTLFGTTVFHRQFFEAGRMALGCDSRLSGSRDLLGELRVARDESGLSARELFETVTAAAARISRFPETDDRIVLRTRGRDPFETLLDISRKDLALVVRRGRPVLADAGLEQLLRRASIPVLRFRVDGAEKVGDARVFRRDVLALEPGIEIQPPFSLREKGWG